MYQALTKTVPSSENEDRETLANNRGKFGLP
jgi:hypothetical protein